MMTPRQATTKALQLFHTNNPNLTNAQIVWTRPMTRVQFPTGMRGLLGEFTATADGYRPHHFIVSVDSDGIMVR